MKLKEIIPIQGPGQREKLPVCYIYPQRGVFRFNSAAAKLLGIPAGKTTKVSFHQDEENQGNWYIEVNKDGPIAVKTWFAKEDDKDLRCQFCSRDLMERILESVDIAAPAKGSLPIPIAGQPTMYNKRKLYGLLVVAAKRHAK